MHGLLTAPLAEFLEFDLPLHLFLVFAGVIILPFAHGTAQGDEIIRVFDLCHIEPYYAKPGENATPAGNNVV